MTPNERLTQTIWEEIDSPQRESKSFTANWNAGWAQYHRLLDASKGLRSQNKKLVLENNSLHTHCKDLRKDAADTIAELEKDLQQAQNRGDEATQRQSEIQQQFYAKEEELEKSAATAQELTTENEALRTQVKDLELSARDVQQMEQSASEAVVRVEDEKSELEKQKSKLEEEVAEFKAGEINALEASHRLQIEFDTLAQEKQQLQDAVDRAEKDQKETLAKVQKEHKDNMIHLKIEQLKKVREVRSERDTAHQEQVNLTILKYAEIMEKKDLEKAAEVDKLNELQQTYDELERDNASALKNLRNAQSGLEAFTSKANDLQSQIDTKEGDLRRVREELDDSKMEIAKEKENSEAVQRDLSIARESAATSKRERDDASRGRRKQAAISMRLTEELEKKKAALEVEQSTTKLLAADKTRAEEESEALRAEFGELERQSAKQLSEARNEVEELRSRLKQETEAADQWRRTKEFFSGIIPSRNPSDDPDLQAITRGIALSKAIPPSAITPTTKEANRKYRARSSDSEPLRTPKIPRI